MRITCNLFLLSALVMMVVVSMTEPMTVQCERINVSMIRPGPQSKFEAITSSPRLKKTATQFAPASDPKEAAIQFIRRHLGVIKDGFVIKNAYRTPSLNVNHFYFRQVVKGVEVTNGDIAVHVDASNRVIAFSDAFYRTSDATKLHLWIGPSSTAFKVIEEPIHTTSDTSKPQFKLRNLPFTVKAPVRVQQSYIHTKDGRLEPTWEFFVRLEYNYFHAHVSADGQTLLSLSDWVSPAMFTVVKMGDKDIKTNGRYLLINPEDKMASPQGWLESDSATNSTTRGNNVEASVPTEDDETVAAVQPMATNGNFSYPIDLTKDPSNYSEASVTNLFYMNNMMHDLSYHYGFDEAAGNFQKITMARAVSVTIDENNAEFYTPPDGEQPTMRMYLWNRADPRRDGALENDIMVHEYTHGISNRLTGGPLNTDCLFASESSGMGEGWGDFFAIWVRSTAATSANKTSMRLGDYVNSESIRAFDYTPDMKANPTTYAYINRDDWQASHQSGVIWGNILYEMFLNLVAKLGFDNVRKSANITKGNTLALLIVVSAMKLQPCNPTFITGRDAIIQAELLLTKGQHKCAIWAAFAKRGVGVKAISEGFGPVTEDFTVPADCNSQ
ncbi:Fungalysin metallopeptidase-domain-containing protein [Syncephalis fuscata]|nr:Fungalysin metallopeptidase-domain-containing protein [Syncephalis fuscata]